MLGDPRPVNHYLLVAVPTAVALAIVAIFAGWFRRNKKG